MNNKIKRFLLIITLIFISAYNLAAQNKIIKGRVVDEDGETIPLASIIINDTVKVGQTDIDGYFTIDIPDHLKNISFAYVGFENALIQLNDGCTTVDVVMMVMWTYDFITLKEVDKLRMKRFKQLPQIHKKAFEKGIFTTAKACYLQEFIPYYTK